MWTERLVFGVVLATVVAVVLSVHDPLVGGVWLVMLASGVAGRALWKLGGRR